MKMRAFFASVYDWPVVATGTTPGRCHFRYYRRRSVISDVIGKASTVKGLASAREPFRIFHISRRAIFPECDRYASPDDRVAPGDTRRTKHEIYPDSIKCSLPETKPIIFPLFSRRNCAPFVADARSR